MPFNRNVRQSGSGPSQRLLAIAAICSPASAAPSPPRRTSNSPSSRGQPAQQRPGPAAFLWARDNTPVNALFALDADYISLPGEDAQTFRATAQRSALPDYSKDGGEASITPSLATLWQQGVTAQTNLSPNPTPGRDARLLPLGVTWLALRSTAVTTHPCPYDNGTVRRSVS